MNTLFNILNDIQSQVTPTDDKDAYEVEFSFAGFSKSQIKITATDELLTVEAKNKNDSKKRTVGLYNNAAELVAVAKLSQPVAKDFTKEALIRVKLDY